MGTETIFMVIIPFVLSFEIVKLNNPLMGTETTNQLDIE